MEMQGNACQIKSQIYKDRLPKRTEILTRNFLQVR
jgi:hypothetical protein